MSGTAIETLQQYHKEKKAIDSILLHQLVLKAYEEIDQMENDIVEQKNRK